MDVFCLLLDCLFFCFAFGCGWLLFLCVLFLACLSFCFVSCPYIRFYRFPGMFRIRSGAWHAKSAAALRCRLFPESIRRHRRGRPRIISDIGRSHGRPSIPPEDRFGPFGSEPAWPSAAAFLLLDRYRVQMIRYGPSPISDSMDGSFRYRSLEVHVVSMDHPVPYLVLDRYIGKWADPDIGSDKWSKLGLWLHSSDSSLFGPFDPWGKWSKWFWLIYSFEPIYR